MRNRDALLLCVVVVIAGCPTQTETPTHDLTLITSNTENNEDIINASVHLTGNPPSGIIYHGVMLVVKDNTSTIAEYEAGNISSDRHVVRINFSTDKRPEKLLVKYDMISGANDPGVIKGKIWDSDSQRYAEYTNYTAEY